MVGIIKGLRRGDSDPALPPRALKAFVPSWWDLNDPNLSDWFAWFFHQPGKEQHYSTRRWLGGAFQKTTAKAQGP
jgi:hypothetical protein